MENWFSMEKISWKENSWIFRRVFLRALVFEQVVKGILRFGCDIYNKYIVVPM